MGSNINPILTNKAGEIASVNNGSSGAKTEDAAQNLTSETGTNENSLVATNFDENIEGATEQEIKLLETSKENIETYELKLQEQAGKIKAKEEERRQLKKQLDILSSQMMLEQDPDKISAIQSKVDSKNDEISNKIREIISESGVLTNIVSMKNNAVARYNSTVESVKSNIEQRAQIEELKKQQELTQQQYNNNNSNNISSNNPVQPAGTNVTSLQTKADFAAYGFTTDDQINRFKQLTPEMQQAAIDLIDYANANGLKVTVTSSFRSNAEQWAVWNRNLDANGNPTGFAARPGSSQHEKGRAIDIKIEGANMDNKNDPKCKLLGQYWTSKGYNWGGTWSGANEPWHFDLRPA